MDYRSSNIVRAYVNEVFKIDDDFGRNIRHKLMDLGFSNADGLKQACRLGNEKAISLHRVLNRDVLGESVFSFS